MGLAGGVRRTGRKSARAACRRSCAHLDRYERRSTGLILAVIPQPLLDGTHEALLAPTRHGFGNQVMQSHEGERSREVFPYAGLSPRYRNPVGEQLRADGRRECTEMQREAI